MIIYISGKFFIMREIIYLGDNHMCSQQESKKVAVTLIIDYHGLRGNETYENVKIPEGSTVLDLLQKKTEVITEGIQYQKMVVSINGISQDPNANLWWVYTVNGKYVDLCADEKLLNNNDVVKWVLITWFRKSD